MKIYVNKINESWIVDRVRVEWYKYNPSISTEKIKKQILFGLSHHGCGKRHQNVI